jgi:DNA ligase-1
MLHRADAPYVTGRSTVLLKLKPLHDADAVVLAHLPGRGRHQGRLGALLVRSENGREFRLGTGLSDALRDASPLQHLAGEVGQARAFAARQRHMAASAASP